MPVSIIENNKAQDEKAPHTGSVNEVKGAIEAILFASGDPVPLSGLAEALGITMGEAQDYIKLLSHDYESSSRGVKLLLLDGAAQLVTKPCYIDAVRAALDTSPPLGLSPQALEVLAVIAYNSPATRAFVEQTRGVDCSYTIAMLTERGLIEEAGTLDMPGRPKLYVTTRAFLRMFGISSLDELPNSGNTGDITMDNIINQG